MLIGMTHLAHIPHSWAPHMKSNTPWHHITHNITHYHTTHGRLQLSDNEWVNFKLSNWLSYSCLLIMCNTETTWAVLMALHTAPGKPTLCGWLLGWTFQALFMILIPFVVWAWGWVVKVESDVGELKMEKDFSILLGSFTSFTFLPWRFVNITWIPCPNPEAQKEKMRRK